MKGRIFKGNFSKSVSGDGGGSNGHAADSCSKWPGFDVCWKHVFPPDIVFAKNNHKLV